MIEHKVAYSIQVIRVQFIHEKESDSNWRFLRDKKSWKREANRKEQFARASKNIYSNERIKSRKRQLTLYYKVKLSSKSRVASRTKRMMIYAKDKVF
jgi:hypothetical protein